MTRIDIISGFLGAGKTTLIKKLLGKEAPEDPASGWKADSLLSFPVRSDMLQEPFRM